MKKLVIAIALALMVSNSYARNDGGENGAGCINNCGNGGGGGQEPPVVTNPINNEPSASAGAGAVDGNTSTNSNSTTINSTSNVDYSKFVPNAYAPPLATGHCMGSASAGGSGAGFGFSLGKTYIDENCNARYDAILLHEFGLGQEAILRLCQQPKMAEALGKYCPEEYQSVDAERWWAE